MAAFTSLAIGLGVGAALGLLHRKKKEAPVAPGPVAPETATTPAQQVAATNPPDTARMESENTGAAGKVAARTRRRAAAGSDGKIGSLSPGQSMTSGSGSPRSLLGS